jgi:hypothetical protein
MLDFNEATRPQNLINDRLNLLIDTALTGERKAQPERKYLGASRLGHPCGRALQYEYMGSGNGESSNLSGQILRIFAAGHLFEELAVRWLRLAGFELLTEDANGEQFGFKALEGRIAGHVDGVIRSAPSHLGIDCPALWEAKSMNNRSWKETVKKGVVLSKPLYAAQVALYQAYMEPVFSRVSQNPCLFTAVNKDTSEIYHELIPFDGALAQRMSDKAVNIIRATEAGELLPRSFSSKEWFECKTCPYQQKCWGE